MSDFRLGPVVPSAQTVAYSDGAAPARTPSQPSAPTASGNFDARAWMREHATSPSHAQSRAQRAPVHSAFLPQLPRGKSDVKQAVVVGAGPGGLSAAIEMATRGIEVTVVELREPIKPDGSIEYSRPVHLNVRQHFLDHLDDLGIYDAVMQRSGFISETVIVDPLTSEEQVWKPKGRRGDKSKIDQGGQAMVDSPSVAQVFIADLETALMQRALELGVKVVQNAEVELAPVHPAKPQSSYKAAAKIKGSDGNSQRLDLGVPDLVVVADGARSPTRERLGIEVLEEPFRARFISGSWEVDIGPRAHLEATQSDSGEMIRRVAMGHAQNGRTWVLTEVPQSRNLSTPEETRAYYRRHSRATMPSEVRSEMATANILWGGQSAFEVRQARAERVVTGDNVILFGDAARSGHFLTSLGVNTAMVSDRYALKQFLDAVNEQGESRTTALQAYAAMAESNTDRWLNAGAKDFVRYVAVNGDGENSTLTTAAEASQVNRQAS